VELKEGAEESVSPKGATAEITGVWPERPGDGNGDPGSPVSSRGEGEREGAGLGRLTDPDPSRVGLTEPGGPIGQVGPAGPNGPRPFV
jgi:hypothetical protein